MKKLLVSVALASLACSPAYAPPVQRMADAQAAYRTAKEAGAENEPAAALHLKLAEQQFAKAKTLLEQENNREADFLLIRSKADAELALAMAKEQATRLAAVETRAEAQKQKALATTPGGEQ
jgi:hypothetical protein